GLGLASEVAVPLIGDGALAADGVELEELRAFGRERQVGVSFELAKQTAKGDVLIRGHLLTRKEQDEVLQQERSDRRGLDRSCLRQANSTDLASERTGKLGGL